MISFKQFLEAQAIVGAKNHTGPGSDTQVGANKAKSHAPQQKPNTTGIKQDLKINKNKPSRTVKDKSNADKLEARLKQRNIRYTKTVDKDGTRFEFQDEQSKRMADRVADVAVDKNKEPKELDENLVKIDEVKEPGWYAVLSKDGSVYEGPVGRKEDLSAKARNGEGGEFNIYEITEDDLA